MVPISPWRQSDPKFWTNSPLGIKHVAGWKNRKKDGAPCIVYLPTKLGDLWGKCWDSYSSTMGCTWVMELLNGFHRKIMENHQTKWGISMTTRLSRLEDNHEPPQRLLLSEALLYLHRSSMLPPIPRISPWCQ